jgi:hypothetical protein
VAICKAPGKTQDRVTHPITTPVRRNLYGSRR